MIWIHKCPLLLANKQARKLRGIVQAWQLEFSRQIFWQKKLIWKNKLRTEPQFSETSVRLFLATKMKCAVVSALISIAFVSQAFAVFTTACSSETSAAIER